MFFELISVNDVIDSCLDLTSVNESKGSGLTTLWKQMQNSYLVGKGRYKARRILCMISKALNIFREALVMRRISWDFKIR